MAAHASMRIMPQDHPGSVKRTGSRVQKTSRPERLPLRIVEPAGMRRGPVIVRKPNVVQKALKAFLPHFGLTFLLLFYLAVGSWIFIKIETSNDEVRMKAKVDDLKAEYKKILNNAYDKCKSYPDRTKKNEAEFADYVISLLQGLHEVHHKHDPVYLDAEQLKNWDQESDIKWISRWNWPTSILHTLGILTTTGYSYVQLFSRPGQLFAIFYGLIGFPLTFITAANIGKFLSEMVTFLHNQYQKRTSLGSNQDGSNIDGSIISIAPRDSKGSLVSSMSNDIFFEMPAWAILGFTFAFCCVGAGMYMCFMSDWNFITALYFAFNAVTNVTLGDLPVHDIWFSLFTVVFVIFGLAVVTMSIDLAQNQLRHLFQRIHYFGRKIQNFWYGHFRASQIDEDVQEVLKIISTIRKEQPEKEHVTRVDILDYLNRKILTSRSGVRGAFSPDGISVLPFADDNISMMNIDPNRLATIDSDTEWDHEIDVRGRSASRKATREENLLGFGHRD